MTNNGEPLPDNAFIANIDMPVIVDTVGKVINSKLGGGGVNETLPPQITNLTSSIGNETVTLSWVNPVDNAYSKTIIVRKLGNYSTNPSDSTKIYDGTAQTFADTGLTNGTEYFYTAYSCNAKGQFQTMQSTNKVTATPMDSVDISTLPIRTKINTPDGVFSLVHQNNTFAPNSVILAANFGTPQAEQMYGWNSFIYYPQSKVRTYINSTYYNSLSDMLKALILTATVPIKYYDRSTATSPEQTLSDKIWLYSRNYIFNGMSTAADKIIGVDWWTSDSDGYTSNTQRWFECYFNGASSTTLVLCETAKKARPFICIPNTTKILVTANADGSYNLATMGVS